MRNVKIALLYLVAVISIGIGSKIARLIKVLGFCLLVVSCGSRKAEVERTRLGIIEQSAWTRTAPGERVYIVAPKQEPKRPEVNLLVDKNREKVNPSVDKLLHIAIRDTTLYQRGENGAELTVRLRGREFIDADCRCPEVKEQGQERKETDLDQKNKKVEREGMSLSDIAGLCIVAFLAGIIAGGTIAKRVFK